MRSSIVVLFSIAATQFSCSQIPSGAEALALEELPWPSGHAPTSMPTARFVRIPSDLARAILAKKRFDWDRSEQSPLVVVGPAAACDFLAVRKKQMPLPGLPSFVAEFGSPGPTYYIFSGGSTAEIVRDFSSGVIVTKGGEVFSY